MICKNCGKDVDNLDIICPYCKDRLDDNNFDLDSEPDLNDTAVMDVEKFLSFDNDDIDEKPKKKKISKDDNKDIFKKKKVKAAPVFHDIDKDDEYEDDEYEYYGDDEGGFLSSKILVVILAIVLIVAVGLAIKFLLLDKDDIGIKDTGKTPEVTETIKKPDDNEPEKPTEPAEPEKPSEPEEKDVNVEDAIASNKDLNENIDVLEYNSGLAYRTGKAYETDDITGSKAIENTKRETAGENKYLDEIIVGTLVKFNSTWIDYVNDGSKDVFGVAMPNSVAYKNVQGFKRIGVTEEFLLFEIGDIRKGEKGYYVWTHEKIKKTIDGKSEFKEYYWIYMLEEKNDKFYVSNYYRY